MTEQASTPLASYGFAHPSLIFEEAFGVAPRELFPDASVPKTLGELAAVAGKSVAAVAKRLEEIKVLTKDMEISATELQAQLAADEPPLLIDVREEWEFDICKLPGSVLLANVNFMEFFPQMQKAKSVVTICHHGMRSYSAAIYLREKGISAVKSLAGGVDQWARDIDPQMRRY